MDGFNGETFTHLGFQSNIVAESREVLLLDMKEIKERFCSESKLPVFGVFNNSDYKDMIKSNSLKRLPVTLYESPDIAIKLADKNMQEPVIVQFILDISITKNNFGIDMLIPELKIPNKDIKKYKDRIQFIRRYNTKEECIEFEVFNISRLNNPSKIDVKSI